MPENCKWPIIKSITVILCITINLIYISTSGLWFRLNDPGYFFVFTFI